MAYYAIKLAISAALIVTISEISKQSSLFSGLIASLPIVSVLAIIWMHHEGQSPQSISQFSMSVFWLVIPSLLFFVALPQLLKMNLPFYVALLLSCFITAAGYTGMIKLLQQFNIQI